MTCDPKVFLNILRYNSLNGMSFCSVIRSMKTRVNLLDRYVFMSWLKRSAFEVSFSFAAVKNNMPGIPSLALSTLPE